MASFWDEIKDMFKTKSQKEEERQSKLKDALEKEGALDSQLKVLDDAYREYEKGLITEEDLEKLFPSDSGLKEIEYTVKTDEEIADEAAAAADRAKAEASGEIERGYEKDADRLSEAKESAKQNRDASYEELKELYDALRERTENDALKRGVARSSIVTGQLGALDSARMQSQGEVDAAYNAAAESADRALAQLEADRERALGELDLKYAADLQDSIDKLKADRDKTVREYEKYNNDIRKKQNEYAADREKDIAEYLKKTEDERSEHEQKYGYSGAKQLNYARRYELAYDFYMSLSPDIAAAALEASPNMRYYLGNHYQKLLGALKDRGEGSKVYF